MIRALLAAAAITTLAFAFILGAFGPKLPDGSSYASFGYTGDQADQVARFEEEAAAFCQTQQGINAGWLRVSDGAIVCTDKRGRRGKNQITTLVRVGP